MKKITKQKNLKTKIKIKNLYAGNDCRMHDHMSATLAAYSGQTPIEPVGSLYKYICVYFDFKLKGLYHVFGS